MTKAEYLGRLQLAVEHWHRCYADHTLTVAVHEVLQDKTIWHGEVEVFHLVGHPTATRCYAWSHREGKRDLREKFVAVLELPPVISPETAVRAQISRNQNLDGF